MSETAGGAVLEAPVVTAIDVTEIALIDLSSIAYPIYLTSSGQPDPDFASQQIVARIRALTAAHPKAAICCDKGKSFRAEISADYKANRPPAEAALHYQIALAKEQLEADGFPVWAIKGYEADDLIATACRLALSLEGVNVLIVSADKDLFQLVGPRVRQLTPRDGTIYDAAAVLGKFGVRPDQICDYLTLVGDASDNVKGAKGIGAVTAAKLLAKFGDLPGIYAGLDNKEISGAVAVSLAEFRPRAIETGSLIALRADAEIPFADLDNDRVAKDLPPMEGEAMEAVTGEVVEQAASAPVVAAVVEGLKQQAGNPPAAEPVKQATQAIAVQDSLAPAPVEFERQLEPRSIGQAFNLAKAMHEARMFNGYGSAQAVLSTVLAGRELGMQAVASLRAFHVIEGKHALAADAMRGLVLRSGQAKYFRCVERTPERVTFETWRAGEPEAVRLSCTRDEARAAFGFESAKDDKARAELDGKWLRSSWTKHPADMLAARASSKLARLVYADILFGLYAPEELAEGVA